MFGKTINLFNLMGFEVKLDLSWIIIAILITWSLASGYFPILYPQLPAINYWIMGLIGAIGLFLSIIIHEFAHSLVARKNGIPMRGITLFIFGGVAEMSEDPPNPKAEFLMAIVGPLTSILLGIIFYGIYYISATNAIPSIVAGVFFYLGMINGILAIFNLIPAFPLDGGRVLRSILWGWKKDIRWATRVSSGIGTAFGLFIIFLGILNIFRGNFIGGIWWLLIGMFLQNAAQSSYQQIIIKNALEGEPVSRFMNDHPVTVNTSTTIDRIVNDYIYKYHFKMFPVIEDNSGRLYGCITLNQIKEIPRSEWTKMTAEQLANRASEENTIDPKTDSVKALSMMNQTGSSRLMVTDDGELRGIVSLKDMLRFLAVKVELEQ